MRGLEPAKMATRATTFAEQTVIRAPAGCSRGPVARYRRRAPGAPATGRSPAGPRRVFAGLAGVLIFLALLSAAASVSADGVEFKRISLTLSEDGRILLDADIGYDLNPTILEALENGVPLTFETHVQMRRASAWIWQADTVEHRLRTVLRYRPLSALYELRNLQGDERLSFATREAALRTLGKIVAMPVVDRSALEMDTDYLVRIQVRLDIESLPLPMRPRAYLSRDWDLESEPWEWRLRP
jgi:hypothetical protein